MLTKNVVGNLLKRYTAVLKKCAWLNACVLTGLLCGGVGGAQASSSDIDLPTAQYGSGSTQKVFVFVEDASGNVSLVEKNFVGSNTIVSQDITYNYDNTSGTRIDLPTGGGQTISGNFIEQNSGTQSAPKSDACGGAIHIGQKGTLGDIKSNFIDNYTIGQASSSGGAIYLQDLKAGSIIGDFVGNYSGAPVSYGQNIGGAIALINGVSVTNIQGNFIGNRIYAMNSGFQAEGGAIANNSSTIQSINGDFIGNSATCVNSDALGGAIHNNGSITTISGNFIGNFVSSTAGNSFGGAISNLQHIDEIAPHLDGNGSTTAIKFESNRGKYGGAISNSGTISTIKDTEFIKNTAVYYGGAIYNRGTMTLQDTSFTNNSALYGGAIFNSGTATVIAQNKDVVFDGNTNTSGGFAEAIYNSSTLNLKAANGKNIIFNDTIVAGGNVIIGDTSELYKGTVKLNNFTYGGATLTLQSGTLEVGESGGTGLLANMHLNADGGTIDTLDDTLANYNLKGIAGQTIEGPSNTDFLIDIDLITEKSDTFTATAGTISGIIDLQIAQISTVETIELTAAHFDGAIEVFKISDADPSKIQGFEFTVEGHQMITYYTETRKSTFHQSDTVDKEGWLEYSIEKSPNPNTLQSVLCTETGPRIYSMMRNESIASNSVMNNFGDMLIRGNGNTITNTSGSISIGKGLNLTVINANSEADFMLHGTDVSKSKLVFNNEGNDMILAGDIHCDSMEGNTVVFQGSGTNRLQGEVKNASIDVNTKFIRGDYDTNVVYNLNAGGVLTYENDTHLYDSTHHTDSTLTTLHMNGGTLDLRNGAASEIKLASGTNLGANTTTHLALDVDLAKGTMDTLSMAQGNWTIGNGAKLAITDLKILSDKAGTSSVLFTNDKKLQDAVIWTDGTSIKGYSPVYSYVVNYEDSADPTQDGHFLFTQTGYNPEVLTPAVSVDAVACVHDDIYKEVFTLSKDLGENVNGEQQAGAFMSVFGGNEAVDFSNFVSSVDMKSMGTIVGYSSGLRGLSTNVDGSFSVYTAYTRGESNFEENELTQDTYYLGSSAELYYDKIYFMGTVLMGITDNEVRDSGAHTFASYSAGVALEAGYVFDLGAGFSLQPNIFGSATYITSENYHTGGGADIDCGDTLALKMAAGVQVNKSFSYSLDAYIMSRYVYSQNEAERSTANGISLPEMTLKPYAEYGLGVSKRYAKISFFLEGIRRDGGREGWGGQLGFKYTW